MCIGTGMGAAGIIQAEQTESLTMNYFYCPLMGYLSGSGLTAQRGGALSSPYLKIKTIIVFPLPIHNYKKTSTTLP